VRNRGHGPVGIDATGASIVSYQIADPLDIEHLRRVMRELARIQEAAGAERMHCVTGGCRHGGNAARTPLGSSRRSRPHRSPAAATPCPAPI